MEMMHMEKKTHKRKTFTFVMLILIVLAIAVGYAWFAYKHKLASLTRVNSPGEVSIAGVHGGEMNGIDLSYENENVSSDKIVTVQNVICIRSNSNKVRLEVAHTQNVEGLVLKLYPAIEKTTYPGENTSYICKKYKDKNYYYLYNTNDGFSTDSNSGLNLFEQNKDKGKAYTYGDNEERVQSLAVPIYWESKDYVNLDSTSNTDNTNLMNYNYYKYFIVEANWKEKDKETDIVYVMAK